MDYCFIQMETEFSEWLLNELKIRKMEPIDLAKAIGGSPATIYRILNGERRAGDDVCRSIAQALNVPQWLVFVKAGLLTQAPRFDDTELELQMKRIFDNLSDEDQEELLALARFKAERNKSRKQHA